MGETGMRKMDGHGRGMRVAVVCGIVAGMLLAFGASPLVVAADPPKAGGAPPVKPLQGGTPAANPRRPGNHAAADAYFYSQRVGPDGKVSGIARANALTQAQSLPGAKTLPAALGGKGKQVGKDALAPPTAVWQQLGPAPEDSDTLNPTQDYRFGRVSGRATAIIVGPHTGVIYLGTADGGVWRSVNDGASWAPLTDGQQSLAIGSLALDPADATDQTLYAGTGETNYDIPPAPVFNGDAYFGVGVLKTTDGGATWSLLGQATFGGYSANSLGIGAMVASGPIVWAGTTQGLFKSTDGGTTWTPIAVAAGSPTMRVTDVIVDGANVYVLLSEAGTGFPAAGIYKSTTGGTAGSFNPIMSGLPAPMLWDRAQVALAPSSNPASRTLYLAIANSAANLLGMFKTTNGGMNWAQTTAQPPNYFYFDFTSGGAGQGDYDAAIAVDPANANLVYAGGVHAVASTDGGVTWAKIADVYCNGADPAFTPCRGPIHPDMHAFAFGSSGTPRPLYVANDGGIWKTTNGNAGVGTTWTDLNGNLATTQFYAGDVAKNFVSTPVIAAGSQDNGTSRTGSATIGVWNGILGGDGGYVAIDKNAPNTIYAGYPQGSLWKTTIANAGTAITWTDISPRAHGCNTPALFVFPFVIDRNSSTHLVFGGGNVCESTNGGTTWAVSDTGLAFPGTVQAVAIAPSDSATVYAADSGGYVHKATNANTGAAATWADCDSLDLPSAPTTSLAVDPAVPGTAYATFGNFGPFSGFGNAHVFKTTDCTTWTNITGNLPDVPVTSIITYPISGGAALIVGTDVGVFLSTNNGTTWSALRNGLPKVGVQQVFADTDLTTLFVATHGRGVWEMPIPSDMLAAPTAGAINPAFGSPSGATPVTITGTNFLAGAKVYFDGVAAGSVVVVNATTITAVTPAHQPAVVPVTVVNTDNQGATLAQGYTFDTVHNAPPPQPAGPTNPTAPNPRPPSQPAVPSPGNPNPLPPPRP